jgi:Putative DNA-binding domain
MPSLQSLQDTMTAAILGGDVTQIAKELKAGRVNAAGRFNIFRNNSYASLTECLKAVFPVTMRLSDERFFDYAAHAFIAARPPREARLSQYGAEFPRFLATFAPCRDFPVIAEMASLEWAIAGTLNDAEELAAPISLIKELGLDGGKFGLRLQPNLRFTVSRWPLIGVWSDHKKEEVVITGPLKRRVSRVVISRHGEDIHLLELDAARFAFWRSLARGLSIEAAAERALTRDPLFDLIHETIAIFRSKLVTGAFIPIEKGIQQ